MRRTSPWFLLGGVALLMAAVGYRLGGLTKTVENPENGGPHAFHATVLTDLDGKPQAVSQWRGKILVANYWATWCHPCREEMPGFSRLQEKHLANGVQFIGISIDDAAKIADFQKTTPVNYPLLIGDMKTMQASAELGNNRQALPFTAVFDREGKLAMTRLGRWAEADLDRQLADLIPR